MKHLGDANALRYNYVLGVLMDLHALSAILKPVTYQKIVVVESHVNAMKEDISHHLEMENVSAIQVNTIS